MHWIFKRPPFVTLFNTLSTLPTTYSLAVHSSGYPSSTLVYHVFPIKLNFCPIPRYIYLYQQSFVEVIFLSTLKFANIWPWYFCIICIVDLSLDILFLIYSQRKLQVLCHWILQIVDSPTNIVHLSCARLHRHCRLKPVHLEPYLRTVELNRKFLLIPLPPPMPFP